MAYSSRRLGTGNGNGDYFERAKVSSARRLIASICAGGGGGKTEFGLSAPAPMVYLNIDPNSEPTIEARQDDKELYLKSFIVPYTGDSDVQRIAGEQWDNFKEANLKILNGDGPKGLRSVVWDTATEVYTLPYLKEFGRTNQIQWFQRAPVDKEYADLIAAYRSTRLNLILLHQVREEWATVTQTARVKGRGVQKTEDRVRTGGVERDGYKKMEYLTQVEAFLMKDSERETDEASGGIVNKFGLKVTKCTQNTGLEGEEFWGATKRGVSKVDFTWLACQVFPQSDREEWR